MEEKSIDMLRFNQEKLTNKGFLEDPFNAHCIKVFCLVDPPRGHNSKLSTLQLETHVQILEGGGA